MSGKLVGEAYKISLPKGERNVLIALCEKASDDGDNCFPGVDLLAWMTGYTPRHVDRILRLLEDKRLIEPTVPKTGGRGNRTQYKINLLNGEKKKPLSLKSTRKALTKTTEINPDILSKTLTFEALQNPDISDTNPDISDTNPDISDTETLTFEASHIRKNRHIEPSIEPSGEPSIPFVPVVPESPPKPKPERPPKPESFGKLKATVEEKRAVEDCFDFWVDYDSRKNTKLILDSDRWTATLRRLREGYTVDEIKAGIRGIKFSPHHQGQNDSNAKYDDLYHVCKSPENLERFIRLDEESASPAPVSRLSEIGRKNAATTQQWLDRKFGNG